MANDAHCRLYLAKVFELLEGPRRPEVLARAQAVIAQWSKTPNMDPFYSTRWTALLSGPVAVMRAVVLGNDEDAARLRHCMPFAGILDNATRATLRRAAVA
jgi:hypothetical protein